MFIICAEKEGDIQAAATSLSNCINLLLPHPDDFFIADSEDTEVLPTAQRVLPTPRHQLQPDNDSDDDEGSQDAGLREIGLLGYNHSIQVDFTPSKSEEEVVFNCVEFEWQCLNTG